MIGTGLHPRNWHSRLHPREAHSPLLLCLALAHRSAACAHQTGAHWLMLLSICLVSATASHGPNKVLPSLLLYCFGTFLVTTVTASVDTNTSAWAVQIIPWSLNYFSLFCFVSFFTKPHRFVLSSPILPFSEALLFLVYIFTEQSDI